MVFATGLAVAGWVGVGYVALSPLALAVTALIALVYIFGALELYRYQQATGTLERALNGLAETPATLSEWISKLDPSLRDAARLRVEGERVGLPGPALTPYLVGLLVLLGMLGTFLGMVATLRGTGLALESATDLQAIRASLAAPVTGLGFAFGTSVAGVATSAMLGLLSALCRRDRARAARRLDAQASTTLRVYSQMHQREESLRLLQQQAQALPLVADRLQAMMATMEQHSQKLNGTLVASQEAFHAKSDARHTELAQQSQVLNERFVAAQEALHAKNETAYAAIEQHAQALNEHLLAGQAAFYAKTEQAYSKLASSAEAVHSNMAASTETAYSNLAASVQASLKDSLAESARAAGMAIQPAVESTLAGLTRENTALQETIRQSVQQQLEALSSQFEQSTAKVAGIWVEALGEHRQVSASLVEEQRRIAESLIQANQHANESMMKTQQEAGAALIQEHQQAGQSLIQAQQTASEAFVKEQQQAGKSLVAAQQNAGESLASALRGSLDTFTETFEQRSAALVDNVATRLGEVTTSLAGGWDDALAHQQNTSQELAQSNQQALTTAIAAIEQHASSLVNTIGESNDELKAALASQDSERLAAWAAAFTAISATLRDEWQQTSDTTASRQKEICNTLAQTANDIATQTREHSTGTIAEIERLVTAAAEAPRVAAEVVAEVRDKLSDSMARDNAMLEERGRLLETLATLLDAVNHASNEQRTAVDALLTSSSDLLDRIGTQVTDKVETEAGKLGYMASQVSASAIEIATLGDTFGKAVQMFSESNASLVDRLQRIEEALDKSLVRSDEQLAYYVAQAREVIDLSILSQKQILEALQTEAMAGSSKQAGDAKPSKGAAKA